MLIDGAKATATRKIGVNETHLLFVSAPTVTASSLPSDVKPGDFLIGQLALIKDDKYPHAHVHCSIGAVKGGATNGGGAQKGTFAIVCSAT